MDFKRRAETDDTIAAVSTPFGEGGIGIVRLSGPEAIRIADSVFRAASGISLPAADSHTLHYGVIRDGDADVDEVLVSIMRAPRTYTRDDVVEINGHGGMAATRRILELILERGARLAERGEFTQRAFQNGRITLDQAKSVADVIHARTRLGLEVAVSQLQGRFSDEVDEIRGRIQAALAALEVGIDYPEIDLESDPYARESESLLENVHSRLVDLRNQADHGRVLWEGFVVALIGRPNVGKSTLFNALLAENRAIVTPVPGTTRDTIEAEITLSGIPVTLIDTAGLRSTDDVVETEGVQRTELAVRRSDLVLLLVDGASELTNEDRALLERSWERPVVHVLTKSDLPARTTTEDHARLRDALRLAPEKRQGLDLVRDLLEEKLVRSGVPQRQSSLYLDVWEVDRLQRMQHAVGRALESLRIGRTPDMIIEDLRSSLRIAAELQGIDVGEETLAEIFGRFCVGK
ncbi:tRNA uridine-5-carboxymethylaminomethyl(34) synthesis GTPase MnmE [Candidatus Bipolaricaulota bacterium]|nr:tRNA uridine-5-carboxymethylaminomethyl(34) synthesis GTPase MnmE [Candidatus Bipolaricaulota bacterium]